MSRWVSSGARRVRGSRRTERIPEEEVKFTAAGGEGGLQAARFIWNQARPPEFRRRFSRVLHCVRSPVTDSWGAQTSQLPAAARSAFQALPESSCPAQE